LIELALASVRRQTYPHWEVRIVGDNCSAEVAERLAALEDPRISFRNRSLRGPYPDDREARWLVSGTYPYNEALAEANGDWIAPLDDDDEWSDDHLEILLREAQATGAELVYGIMRVVIDGSEVETWFGKWPPQKSEFAFQSSLYHGGLRHFRYDTHTHLRGEPADFDLARRMLEAGVRFHFIEQVVGTYHVDPADHHAQWWQERASERPAWRPPISRVHNLRGQDS
jgi:glycosyltransferase involved in cell wall biosynthesis